MNRHGGNIMEASERLRISSKKITDFSANINPLGLSPFIKKAMKEDINSILHYPDPRYKYLKQNLSHYYGISEKNILPGNGSSELIYLLAEVLSPSRVTIVEPNFSEYEASLQKIIPEIKHVTGTEEQCFKPGTNDIMNSAKNCEIIYLSSPNNPVGYIYPRDELIDLLEFCEKRNIYLFIDEVFIDFIYTNKKISMINLVSKYNHLIVLRSFTKFFAIPGLRLGAIAASRKLISALSSKAVPWSINNLAQSAGIAATKDKEYIDKTISFVTSERRHMVEQINKLKSIKCFNSWANYLLCKITNGSLKKLELGLGEKGILIRNCSNYIGLNNKFFRIAVRNRRDNTNLLNAMRNFLKLSNIT